MIGCSCNKNGSGSDHNPRFLGWTIIVQWNYSIPPEFHLATTNRWQRWPWTLGTRLILLTNVQVIPVITSSSNRISSPCAYNDIIRKYNVIRMCFIHANDYLILVDYINLFCFWFEIILFQTMIMNMRQRKKKSNWFVQKKVII